MTLTFQFPANYGLSISNYTHNVVVWLLVVRPSLDHKFSPDIHVLHRLQQFIRVTTSCQLVNVVDVVGVMSLSSGVAVM